MPSPVPLLDAARSRWAQMSVEHPDVGAALPLHQALLTLQIELLEGLPHEEPVSVGPTGGLDTVVDSLAAGVPAFRAVDPPASLAAAVGWLGRFADALSGGGAGPAAAKVKRALADGLVDPLAVIGASWHRHPDAMAELTRAAGLNLQAAWLVAELATAPWANRSQEALLAGSESVRDAVAAWGRGDCPACGAWPALAEYFLGDRVNRCAYCAAAWPIADAGCTYCGESGDDFRVVATSFEHPGRRLEVCRACGGYLKTIDVGRSIPFPLLAIEDLASQDLDRAAQHHGFRRMPLRGPAHPLRTAARGTRT